MNLDDLAALVKTRRSIRKWRDEPVPDELLRKALDIAVWAPNGGNFQNWRFFAVTDPETIRGMGQDVQESADRIAGWNEAAEYAEAMERSRRHAAFFRNAPAVIAVTVGDYASPFDRVLSKRADRDVEAAKILGIRRAAHSAVQSAAAAAMLLLLALHQQGLGAVWLAAPLIAAPKLLDRLGAEPGRQLICLIAVGYADESPEKDRLPVDSVATFIPPREPMA